jgi:hypothetical protein
MKTILIICFFALLQSCGVKRLPLNDEEEQLRDDLQALFNEEEVKVTILHPTIRTDTSDKEIYEPSLYIGFGEQSYGNCKLCCVDKDSLLRFATEVGRKSTHVIKKRGLYTMVYISFSFCKKINERGCHGDCDADFVYHIDKKDSLTEVRYYLAGEYYK